MKQFISFIRKEFRHIFRDSRTMLILLIAPIVQLMIFSFAITTEINNISFVVLDQSKTTFSRQIVDRFSGSKYFNLQKNLNTIEEVENYFQKGKTKLALVIPIDFCGTSPNTNMNNIQLLADASTPNEASTIIAYAQQIIMQHSQNISTRLNSPFYIKVKTKMLYNPQLKSSYNFVPGIIGLILMLICAMMTSISIVREKEQGTMEILLVSPIKPIFIILAKAIPYVLIAFLDVLSILFLSKFLLNVPVEGNLFLLLFLCFVFNLSALSLGILISSVTSTQQAAMLISGVGLILPTLLLSGLIFPIENMPWVLQLISNIIPAKWFIIAVKDVMIKGLGFYYIWSELLILLIMTLLLLAISIKQFKNRL